jgi:hypothetical protein
LTTPVTVTGSLALQLGEVATIPGLPQTDTGTIYTHTPVGTMQVGASGAVLTASGGVFQVSYIVTDPLVSSGSTVTIVTSSDGTTWTQNIPTATCVLDANKTCSFTTDHLGLFGFVSTTSAPVPPIPDTIAPVVTLS